MTMMLLRIQLPRVFCVGRGVMVLLMHRTGSVSLVFIPSVVCVSPAGTGTGVGDLCESHLLVPVPVWVTYVRVTWWYRYRCW
jgi:hypothetical protein